MGTLNQHSTRYAILTVVLMTAWPSSASAQIEWRSGASTRSGRQKADIASTLVEAGSGGERSHIVLQFDEPMTPGRRDTLAAAGVVLQAYLGNHAFFVSVSPNVDHAAVGRVASLTDARGIQTQ